MFLDSPEASGDEDGELSGVEGVEGGELVF
jgi:hypothetical protein